MKEPRLDDLEVDERRTRLTREKVAAAGKIKITINIDRDSLEILRGKSSDTGIPYQRLLNQVLRRALADENQMQTRLDRIEKEIARLKRTRVA